MYSRTVDEIKKLVRDSFTRSMEKDCPADFEQHLSFYQAHPDSLSGPFKSYADATLQIRKETTAFLQKLNHQDNIDAVAHLAITPMLISMSTIGYWMLSQFDLNDIYRLGRSYSDRFTSEELGELDKMFEYVKFLHDSINSVCNDLRAKSTSDLISPFITANTETRKATTREKFKATVRLAIADQIAQYKNAQSIALTSSSSNSNSATSPSSNGLFSENQRPHRKMVRRKRRVKKDESEGHTLSQKRK